MEIHLTSEQYNLLAVDRIFDFNGANHYLEWTIDKFYNMRFYLVPMTIPLLKRDKDYFKRLGIEVKIESLDQIGK